MRAVILCLLLVAGPAPGFEWSGNTITLTPSEVALCEAGGGCVLMTQEQARQVQALIEGHRMCLYRS